MLELGARLLEPVAPYFRGHLTGGGSGHDQERRPRIRPLYGHDPGPTLPRGLNPPLRSLAVSFRAVRPPRVGDVIEFQTGIGFAYAQVIAKIPSWGPLIRVLAGAWEHRPQSLEGVAAASHRFYVFFPVGAAISRGLVAFVGNVPVPGSAREFPLLRQRGRVESDGQVTSWWLWDGAKKWRVGQLTPEQKRLSIAELINDTLLVARVENDWRPEQDS
jgi:hypothetical protein